MLGLGGQGNSSIAVTAGSFDALKYCCSRVATLGTKAGHVCARKTSSYLKQCLVEDHPVRGAVTRLKAAEVCEEVLHENNSMLLDLGGT